MIPSSSATDMACIGPAPPKPSRVKSRGSKPRCTETSRTAPAILATAIRSDALARANSPPPPPARSPSARNAARAPPRVEDEPAREGPADGEAPEEEVRVGHRRLRAPPAVAGRSGRRAGALRPDPEGAVGLNPHDRAAAGPDGVDVELRHLERESIDPVVVRHAGREPVHEGDVGARAPHVERDDVFDPRALRDPDRAGDPADRPGEKGARAPLRRRPERHRAPRSSP